MKKEQNISDISVLILKNLQGELSIEERDLLNKWSDESEDNCRLRQQLTDYHIYQNEYNNFLQVKSLNDWQEIHRKINKKSTGIWRKAMRYAAVILVFFGSLFGVYHLIDEEDSEVKLVKHVIVPGSSKAVLTIAGGEKVMLGSVQDSTSQLLKKYGILARDTSLEYKPMLKYDEYHTLEVPRGGEYILKLADGSRVWLNAETILKFPVQFSQKMRKVFLISGEAYFQVAKDTLKPFYVECADMAIEVTGTEFNVMAYDDKGKIETTLVEGGVSVSCCNGKMILNPSEQAVFFRADGSITKHYVDTEYYTSWKNGIFEFREMPLVDVMEQLGRWYDINYLFQNETLKQIRFTGAIKRSKELKFILDVIQDTQLVHYKIDGNTVIISANNK